MSTYSGFGTAFYGWQHFADGTSTATRWVCLFYIPVLPLRRARMRVLTNFASEGFFPKKSAAAGAKLPLIKVGVVAVEDRYQVLEELPLAGAEILLTYMRTFVLMPLAMLWPFAVVVVFGQMAKERNWLDQMWAIWVFVLLGIGALGNVLAVAIWAIRQSRGMGTRARAIAG